MFLSSFLGGGDEQTALLTHFQQTIFDQEIAVPLLLAFVAGLFSTLSPCVYPLIPITLSVMGARRYESHVQGFLVSLFYVLGMSAVYTVLGVMFSSLGTMLGAMMQHKAVVLAIAFLLVIFAMSMLGVFSFTIPESINRRLMHIGGQGKKGAFLMGMVAGVVAGPCTGPILGFILTIIAEQKQMALGAFLMLGFSFGMGIPFLVLGTFSSAISRLPKSGRWLLSIKQLFGGAMLGAAIYYLALASPRINELLASLSAVHGALLLVLLAVGIVLLLLPMNPSRPKIANAIQISVGALLAGSVIATLIITGGYDQEHSQAVDERISWHVINSDTRDRSMLDKLLSQALQEERPVLIDFYADWCVACKQLEHETLKDEAIVPLLTNFQLVRIDSTNSSDYLSELHSRFNVVGLPAIVFFDRQGHLVRDIKVIGNQSKAQFLAILKKLSPL